MCSHSPKVQPLKCRFFLWNSSSKIPKTRTSLPPFGTVLCRQAAFSWRHFDQEILSKCFNYHSGYGCSSAIFLAKHASNSEMVTCIEDFRLEKCTLLTLWRMQSQLHFFILPVNFESDEMTSHKHGLTAKTVLKWRLPRSLLSRQISFG